MDSLRFENFALISILFCLGSLFMGSGQLRLSLAKNICHHSLIFPVISRKNKYGFNKLFRLNDGGVYSNLITLLYLYPRFLFISMPSSAEEIIP